MPAIRSSDSSDVGIEPLVEVTVEPARPGVVLVRARGEIDLFGAPELQRNVEQQLAVASEAVVLDLGGVSFMGSSGLAVLVAGRDTASRYQVELRVVASTRAVLRPLACTGLSDMFDIYPSVEAALGEPAAQ